MTRSAIRHTLAALAAAALVSAFAGSAGAGDAGRFLATEAHSHRFIFTHSTGLISQGLGKPKAPTGLATKKGSQETHNSEDIESLKINTPKGRPAQKRSRSSTAKSLTFWGTSVQGVN